MKKIKKPLPVLMLTAVMILSLALAACTRKNDAGTSYTATPAPAATATTAPAVATATPAPATSGEPQSNFNLTGMPIVNEKITLTCMQHIRDIDFVELNGLWYVDFLEEMTNIHIDYTMVKQAEWPTRLNLMFASADLPDVIMGGGAVDRDEYGASQGLLVPLEDLAPDYMPIIYERILADPDPVAALPSVDGRVYGVPYFAAQGINTDGHWFINRTWLDVVGIADHPKTVGELTDVLRAFKDGQPNGGSEIPYMTAMNWNSTTGIMNAMAFWGIPDNDRYVVLEDDETVWFTPAMRGYRECLEWLNLLYNEELLDPDFITQDDNMRYAKLNDGNAGLFTEWRLTVMGFEPIAEHAELMLPVSADGFKVRMRKNMELAGTNMYATIANQYLPETLRWFDIQFDTEVMFNSYFGPEGIGWEYNAAGLRTSSADTATVSQYCLGVNGAFYAPSDYYYSVYEMAPHRVEKKVYCDIYTEAGVHAYFSQSILNNLSRFELEEIERRTLIKTDLDNAMMEYVALFIQSGVTDAKWDECSNTLKQIGVEEYVRLYQTAYDRSFK